MSLTKNPSEVLDVKGCIKDELTPHAGTRYRFKVGNERLEFRDQEVGDPVPTGRQVLQAAGIRSVVDHLLFVMLENGTFAGVRLDELVDLIQRRVKWFVVFKGDRSYRFMLDDRRIEWGSVTISATHSECWPVSPPRTESGLNGEVSPTVSLPPRTASPLMQRSSSASGRVRSSRCVSKTKATFGPTARSLRRRSRRWVAGTRPRV